MKNQDNKIINDAVKPVRKTVMDMYTLDLGPNGWMYDQMIAVSEAVFDQAMDASEDVFDQMMGERE